MRKIARLLAPFALAASLALPATAPVAHAAPAPQAALTDAQMFHQEPTLGAPGFFAPFRTVAVRPQALNIISSNPNRQFSVKYVPTGATQTHTAASPFSLNQSGDYLVQSADTLDGTVTVI